MAAPKPLSMLTTVTPGGAGSQHAEQCGQPAERDAVSDGGGHGHHRTGDEPPHDAGQGALHPGHHDDCGGSQQEIEPRHQAMDAGHPHVEDAPSRMPRMASVSRASSATGMSPVPAVTTATVPTACGATGWLT